MSASAIATSGVTILANTWGTPDMTGGRGPEFGKASPIGLFLILGLLIAVIFLIRSMNRRLRNLPESFDDADNAGGGANAVNSHALNNASPMDDALPSTRGASAGEGTATLVEAPKSDRDDDGVGEPNADK